MKGHSKWANIKHKKAANDMKRAKRTSQLMAEIRGTIRVGGYNLKENIRLQAVVQKAKDANIPKDLLNRALNPTKKENVMQFLYEIQAYGGVGFLIETETDNNKRCTNSIRTISSKHGGTKAEKGAVSYAFKKLGRVRVDALNIDEDAIFELATEAGADDIEFHPAEEFEPDHESEDHEVPNGLYDIQTTFQAFAKVSKVLQEAGYGDAIMHDRSGIMWEADAKVAPDDQEDAEKNSALLNAYQEMEDVVAVWHNMEE